MKSKFFFFLKKKMSFQDIVVFLEIDKTKPKLCFGFILFHS